MTIDLKNYVIYDDELYALIKKQVIKRGNKFYAKTKRLVYIDKDTIVTSHSIIRRIKNDETTQEPNNS